MHLATWMGIMIVLLFTTQSSKASDSEEKRTFTIQELPADEETQPQSVFERLHPRPTYIGVLFRPTVCATGPCETFTWTFGFEAGYRFIGLGARYGYLDGKHYIVPDIRGYFEFMITETLLLMPSIEFSPALIKTADASIIELMFRVGFRILWELEKGYMLFVEPVSFEMAFYDRKSDPIRGVSSEFDFQLRYTPSLGFQLRF